MDKPTPPANDSPVHHFSTAKAILFGAAALLLTVAAGYAGLLSTAPSSTSTAQPCPTTPTSVQLGDAIERDWLNCGTPQLASASLLGLDRTGRWVAQLDSAVDIGYSPSAESPKLSGHRGDIRVIMPIPHLADQPGYRNAAADVDPLANRWPLYSPSNDFNTGSSVVPVTVVAPDGHALSEYINSRTLDRLPEGATGYFDPSFLLPLSDGRLATFADTGYGNVPSVKGTARVTRSDGQLSICLTPGLDLASQTAMSASKLSKEHVVFKTVHRQGSTC